MKLTTPAAGQKLIFSMAIQGKREEERDDDDDDERIEWFIPNGKC